MPEIQGSEGTIYVQAWENPEARHIVLIAHGYGEHIGRYEHVAAALVARGAAVYGPDHLGHGRSEGERVLTRNFEHVVDDLHRVDELAREAYPGLPVVLVGHSMGGLIASRYAQRHGESLAGLVLSAPAIGRWDTAHELLSLPEIPETPIPVETLSRDEAVQRAYAEDPLVWNSGFKRPTIEQAVQAQETVNSTGSLGDLPTLWMHGGDDQLVPIEGTRVGIDHIRGSDFTERVIPGARHEIFNELEKEQTLGEVCDFIDRVTGAG